MRLSAPCGLEICGGDQFAKRDTQPASNLRSQHETNVLSAPLDAAHVRAVDASFMGKRFLGHAQFQSRSPHSSPKRNQIGCLSLAGRGSGHAFDGSVLTSIAPRTIIHTFC